MNSTCIHGRLVRDPEKKYYTNSKGDNGSLAEVIDKYFSKGREIVVSGEMQCHKYEAKDGTMRYPWSLIVNTFDFCGSKKDSSDKAEPEPSGFDDIDDDDMPF